MIKDLLSWFRATDRDLPWRKTYNPYHVWISEIMLQQTQMDRGIAYFHRWIERFPDVHAVAEADEQEILKYWEGLGYYARARNLYKAAKLMVTNSGGDVPCEHDQLLDLPGIGPYTAAAIASIAGNHDVAVIDANVTRVYSRLFDIGGPVKSQPVRKRIATLASNLLPQGKARQYNQALMDLGGLVCLPKGPDCHKCPISQWCKALINGTVTERPELSRPKKQVTLQKVTAVISSQENIYIQQRRVQDVWGGLWEFPGGESGERDPGLSLQEIIFNDCGLHVTDIVPIVTVTHHYTHHKIVLHCFSARLEGSKTPRLSNAAAYKWISPAELSDFAFPSGPRKLLRHLPATL